GYLLVLLLVLTGIAYFKEDSTQGLINAGVAMGTGLVLDLIVGLLQKRKRLLSDGGVLTGLIVTLVLSSATPWYQVAGTVAIALVSKHVLKIKRRPIFNPAAVGLLVAIPLFSSEQSWWGSMPNFPAWGVGFVLVAGYLVTSKVNKFPQVFTFLGVYLLIMLGLGLAHVGDTTDVLRNPFINATLFLAFFMVTDPPTSPAKYGEQVVFGFIAAIVSVIVYLIFGGLAYLLVGLLVANAWNALRFYEAEKRKSVAKVESV
ncbi:MAG: RnfABCDGE type electron transport complex subunit D, partial [Tumebacillaceae bacterium]